MINAVSKLKYYEEKVSEKIFSNKILIALLMLPFFKTSGYNSIPYLNSVTNIILLFECIFFFMVVLLSKRISPLYLSVIVYGIWAYIIAPNFNPTQSPPSFYYIICFLGAIAFIEVAFRIDSKNSIDGISATFVIMIVLNFILALIFKNGIVPGEQDVIYLFGIRTGFSLVIFPGILFCFLYDYMKGVKFFSIRTILCLFVGLGSLLSEWVVTGLIQFAICVTLYFLFKLKFLKKHINLLICFFCIILLNIFIISIGFENEFFESIFGGLNKDITLSGRTYIWSKSINKIQANIIFGYGNDALVDIYGTMKPAHSQWLHIALESGVVGLMILLIAFVFSIKQLNKYKNTEIYYIMSIFIVSILIGCIVEIQTYFAFLFMIFELPYVIEYMKKKEMVEKEVEVNESNV